MLDELHVVREACELFGLDGWRDLSNAMILAAIGLRASWITGKYAWKSTAWAAGFVFGKKPTPAAATVLESLTDEFPSYHDNVLRCDGLEIAFAPKAVAGKSFAQMTWCRIVEEGAKSSEGDDILRLVTPAERGRITKLAAKVARRCVARDADEENRRAAEKLRQARASRRAAAKTNSINAARASGGHAASKNGQTPAPV